MPSAIRPEDAALPTLPTKQRAVIEDSEGKPMLVEDFDIPDLKPGTLLVKTAAVALNPSDYKMGMKFPAPGAVIGMDFTGSIVRIDPEAAKLRPDLKIGDMVCGGIHGSNPAERDNGAFAEYLRTQADLVIKVSKNMGLEKAATLGVSLATNGLALWESLGISASPDKPAEKPFDVLVYGGSTACGTMAIQLLKLSGLNPITTCSPKNFSLVKSYGATAAFDYSLPDVANTIRAHSRGLRHALDCITDADSTAICYAALGRAGGRYTCLELYPESWATRKAVKSEFLLALDAYGKKVDLHSGYERQANPERYAASVHWFKVFQKLLDEGKLKTHPTRVLNPGFEGIMQGLQLLKKGGVSGEKLVLCLE